MFSLGLIRVFLMFIEAPFSGYSRLVQGLLRVCLIFFRVAIRFVQALLRVYLGLV